MNGGIGMGQKLDRVMYEISVVYIALPVFIFLAGWLRLIVAVPVCIIFLVSLILMLRNRPEAIAWHLSKRDFGVILAAVIILAVWLLLSGMGGFSFQNLDYEDRNAIFHDLISKSWPIVYNFSPGSGVVLNGLSPLPEHAVLTYYIAFWLPGALVGKLFGWYAANVFLYFWALTGLNLIVYYMFRTLRRASVRSVLILIFFSGLDIIGYVLRYKGALPSPISQIEWWSGFQYSSNTTLLFWVFNQTLVPWLVVLLLLNMKNSKSLFFMYAMLLLYGPFPFLGMLPFVLWKAYQGFPVIDGGDKTLPFEFFRKFLCWIWSGVIRALSFGNIAGGITVLTIITLYYSNNVSSGRYMGFNTIGQIYFAFFAFEAGLYLLLLFAYFRKQPVYWICLVSLLLIPLIRVGIYQDFCMRVSIPALFMLQIMIQKTLLGEKGTIEDENIALVHQQSSGESETAAITGPNHFFSLSKRDHKLLSISLAALLCIGAVVPIQEITRSMWNSFPEYAPTHAAMAAIGEVIKNSDNDVISSLGNSIITQNSSGQLWYDNKKTLQKVDEVTTNYVASTEGSIFYKYLARQP